jgi:hypothetical protein
VNHMPRRGRGRPSGKVPFLKSDRRFEVAIYVAARSNNMPTYMAGRAALMLMRSVAPITNASLTAHINIASAIHFAPVDKNVEHQCITTRQMAGADISLQRLVALGWRDVLVRIRHRLEPALQSNLPPFDGVLRPATKKRIADQQP